MEQLEEQIKVVAQARQKAREAIMAKNVAYSKWEEQNKSLFDITTITSQTVIYEETTLRELTLKAYAETGDKHPAVGVGINVTTTYEYTPADALKWAKEHNLALTLDKTAFEKIAKADPPDFVTVDKNVLKATISTDLEKVLGEKK